MRVLLIEPDRILAQNLSKAFEKSGHIINWQIEPQTALDSADAKLPDVIILDLMLANRSGVEFLYEFRSYPEWQKVPVVIYSGLSAEELSSTLESLNHLNIASFHYKPATSANKLIKAAEKTLQTATA